LTILTKGNFSKYG